MSNVQQLNPTTIHVEFGFNPRQDYGDLDELKQSITKHGVLMPLRAMQTDSGLTLIDGHRRLSATMMALEEGADLSTIPVMILPPMTTEEALIDAFVSNTGLSLQPLEEADLFNRLINSGFTVKSVAKNVSHSESYVRQRLLLLKAGVHVKEALEQGEVSLDTAYDIIRQAETEVQQEEMLQREREQPDTAKKERKEKKSKKSTNKGYNEIIQYANDLRELLSERTGIDPESDEVEGKIEKYIEEQEMSVAYLWGALQVMLVHANIPGTNPFKLKISS